MYALQKAFVHRIGTEQPVENSVQRNNADLCVLHKLSKKRGSGGLFLPAGIDKPCKMKYIYTRKLLAQGRAGTKDDGSPVPKADNR